MASAIEIVFSDEREDGAELIALVLDASPEQLHRMTAQATDHEVESGIAVTDHVRAEPKLLTLQVIVSNTSLRADLAGPSRARDAWAVLEDAEARGLVAVVTTPLKTYSSMVLIEAQAPVTALDGSWLRAELTFKELRLVQTQTVADPVPARARDRRQVDRGTQNTEPAPERLESLAHRGLRALGLF
jgi:hypothetical protein